MTERAHIEAMEDAAERFVEEYEFDDGDGAVHVPTEFERLMVADAIHGLLADDAFCKAARASSEAKAEQPCPFGCTTQEEHDAHYPPAQPAGDQGSGGPLTLERFGREAQPAGERVLLWSWKDPRQACWHQWPYSTSIAKLPKDDKVEYAWATIERIP